MEPGLALDPASYVAKAMQRKPKEPPTEAEVLSSVRKRPATPPQEGTSTGSPASAVTPQGQISLETLMEAVGTPTNAAAATHSQEDTPGQTQSMDVSQPSEQLNQEAESQPADQQYSQDSASVGATQPPAEQSTAATAEDPEAAPQEEMSENQRLRQERIDKLTRIMLESIHNRDIGIAPAAEAIHKVVVNFAKYATQFDHLAKAQAMLHDYAGKCMQNFYDH